jgi:tetratricopeptide (TPR) repeat protein
MNDPAPAKAPRGTRVWRRPDRRLLTVVGGIAAIAVTGYLVGILPDRGIDTDLRSGLFPSAAVNSKSAAAENEIPFEPLADPKQDPSGHARQARRLEIRKRFEQSVAMLHAKRYDDAITALHRVMELDSKIPEAYVNMGFALIGKQQYRAAFDFLNGAIELNPAQANAYYGIAIVQEAAGNLEGALGGMRSFLHLTDNPDPAQIHVARARSAIWEWEAKLGRGPWGPTRGVPPGFKEEELKRDGKGVGIRMHVGELKADGSMRSEIKAGDRIEMFKP